MNKNGFSLIECMVYCVLMATIMLIWFNGVASFTRLCNTYAYHTNALSTVYSALDVFARDIRKAPHAAYLWPLVTDTAFIFTLPDSTSIGWECTDGQLLRYQGNYNSVAQQWSKKTKSLILDTIQTGSFAFNNLNQENMSAEIRLVSYGKKFSRMSYVLR